MRGENRRDVRLWLKAEVRGKPLRRPLRAAKRTSEPAMPDPDICPNGADMLTRQCTASPAFGRSRCNSSMACMIRIHTR